MSTSYFYGLNTFPTFLVQSVDVTFSGQIKFTWFVPVYTPMPPDEANRRGLCHSVPQEALVDVWVVGLTELVGLDVINRNSKYSIQLIPFDGKVRLVMVR